MRTLVPALTALVVAITAAPASAAPPWSAPENVSSPHQLVDRPSIAFTGAGVALASWTWQEGTHRNASAGASIASRGPHDPEFLPERGLGVPGRVGRSSTLIDVVGYGRRRALLAQVHHVHLDPLRPDADRLEIAYGRSSGSFGPRRAIAAGPQMLRATIAANPRGDIAIAWWERGSGSSRLLVSVLRAGHHAFGAPVRLAARGFGDVALAVRPGRGDVLAAWETRGVIHTRTLAAGHSRFGPDQRANHRAAPQADIQAALAPNGRAAVAWAAQRLTEGGAMGTITYSAAVRGAEHGRFDLERRLETQPGVRLASPVRLAMDSHGRGTVAWAGATAAGALVVRVADAPPGRPFLAGRDVSAPGADSRPAGLVAGPGRRRLVVWMTGTPEGLGSVQAAYAPPAGDFGAPEIVSPGPEARVPRAAFDPLSGRATVVWSERPPGERDTFARAATR